MGILLVVFLAFAAAANAADSASGASALRRPLSMPTGSCRAAYDALACAVIG